MRYLSIIILFLALVMGLAFSCKKWEDPAPVDDPRLTNPYCNDPNAVNYNWGFPGKPDNTICFYPSDLFKGTYKFFDTVYNSQTDLYLSADSLTLFISKISSTQIGIEGLCNSNRMLVMTAGATYQATIDTTVGDSLTQHPGQFFCRTQDTVTGTFTRDKVDSTLIYVDMTVRSDTGSTLHRGRAIKRQ
jgi:hypothetical protein